MNRSWKPSRHRGMRWWTSKRQAAMSDRPPLLCQDERLTLLRRPDQCREDMLAGLLAAPPVWAAAATLAGERHPVDVARLRARRYREAASQHGSDLGPLIAPERETSTYATG